MCRVRATCADDQFTSTCDGETLVKEGREVIGVYRTGCQMLSYSSESWKVGQGRYLRPSRQNRLPTGSRYGTLHYLRLGDCLASRMEIRMETSLLWIFYVVMP